MTTTHLNDLFDKLEPEEGNKLADKIKLEEVDPQKIIELYENYLEYNSLALDRVVNPSDYILKGVKASEITQFSKNVNRLLKKAEMPSIGLYFSGLIRNSEDKNHFLIIEKAKHHIHSIGSYNNKNVYVKGNNIHNVGYHMEEGHLIIDGDSGIEPGKNMTGGKITITGNAPYRIRNLKGGEIIIHGSYNNRLEHDKYNYFQNEDGSIKITPK